MAVGSANTVSPSPSARFGYSTSSKRLPGAPRAMRSVLSLEDLEPVARRLLPRCIFAYVSGGVERNITRDDNTAAFNAIRFVPRQLVDTSARSIAATVFGKTYDAPFGIAPMGAAGIVGYQADLALAEAARAANIPFILSGSSVVAMERVFAANPDAWFQAYLPAERAKIAELVGRVDRAGFRTLVITADTPVPANRENNIRAGFSTPLRPSLRLGWDGITHPRWLIRTAIRTLMTDGLPHYENYGLTRGVPLLSTNAERTHVRDALNWSDIEWVRARWTGRLVIKGILSAADARIARDLGADGVIVSNHGGRQLDGALSSIGALPEVAAAAGRMTVMLDSGVRRGSDVMKAIGLGARMVFAGRPFLYAAALAEEPGIAHAINLLRREVDRDLALLGCTGLTDLASRLWPARSETPTNN